MPEVTVSFPILTILIFLPLLGAMVMMLLPREEKGLVRNMSLLVTGITFLVSLGLLGYTGASRPARYGKLSQSFSTMEFVEQYDWIESLGVTYLVGIDGISLWLVLLTTFLGPILVVSTYEAIQDRVKEFMICFLLLMTGMIGALVALDTFLFYVFWEMMLIPMYFMIGIWGGSRRHYATIKFFTYTMVGSVLMLISILYIYFQTDAGGQLSFALHDMIAAARGMDSGTQLWLFASFLLAFAIKMPLFPFHTWLPDAQAQAPTAGSVVLTGALLNMGAYGLLRYGMPLFPEAVASFAPWVAALSVAGIVYGALVAAVQKDIKKLVAYSSVSHLGFCMLGLMALTEQGIEGAIYVMLAQSIATGGLLLAVGILRERRHTGLMAEFGGLTKVVPVFATFFMILVFTGAGLPGLAGFVGEFLVIVGAAKSQILYVGEATWLYETTGFGPEGAAFLFAAVAATGVIFGAVYLLWMFQRVMFGPLENPKNEDFRDLNFREVAYFFPLIVASVVMGLFPGIFLDKMHNSVDDLMGLMKPALVAKASAAPAVKKPVVKKAGPRVNKKTRDRVISNQLDLRKLKKRLDKADKDARIKRVQEARQERRASPPSEKKAREDREKTIRELTPRTLKVRPEAAESLKGLLEKSRQRRQQKEANP